MYEHEKCRIKRMLTRDDIVCGIAEESSELSQAALKYRRTLPTSENVTPVSSTEALEHIEEEIVDVLMYFEVMGYPLEALVAQAQSSPKWKRWLARLENTVNDGLR